MQKYVNPSKLLFHGTRKINSKKVYIFKGSLRLEKNISVINECLLL